VLLGGGTPVQAGAAQLLVLVGLLAAQTITVVVGSRLVRSGRLLPSDLTARLPA
jgi:putative ABC transport system permease protein